MWLNFPFVIVSYTFFNSCPSWNCTSSVIMAFCTWRIWYILWRRRQASQKPWCTIWCRWWCPELIVRRMIYLLPIRFEVLRNIWINSKQQQHVQMRLKLNTRCRSLCNIINTDIFFVPSVRPSKCSYSYGLPAVYVCPHYDIYGVGFIQHTNDIYIYIYIYIYAMCFHINTSPYIFILWVFSWYQS